MKTSGGTFATVAFVATAVIAIDQVTKEIIVREIGPGADRRSIEIIPDFFNFTFVRNTGSAFGLFQGQSALLMVLAMVAIVFLAGYYFRNARHDSMVAIALALQLGGAVGNVIDRIRYGYVVDFLDFPRWPTFNVADSAITVGVVLLMYALIFRDYETSDSAKERKLHSAGEDS